MSYSANISFKTISLKEVEDFFVKLKFACSKKLKEIAEDECSYLPSVRHSELKDIPSYWRDEIDRKWASDCVFKFRFFYLEYYNLLVMFNIPTAVRDVFDDTIYFQNSVDQDYDYAEWDNVPAFKQIAVKYQQMPTEEFKSLCLTRWGTKGESWEHFVEDSCYKDEAEVVDRYKKTCTYKEVWALLEDKFFDDNAAVFLSIFGHYSTSFKHRFVIACREAYKRQEEEFEREWRAKHPEEA